MPGVKAKTQARAKTDHQQKKVKDCEYDKKYFKLWRRFYEPLILLFTLGPTRGPHSSAGDKPHLHRFLDNVAYICDFQKGGETTSAVAIENTPERFIFWLASNSPKQSRISRPFLITVLQDVRKIVESPHEQTRLKQELLIKTVEYARARVKKELALLKAEMRSCEKFLTEPTDTAIVKWLRSFHGKEGFELCNFAYTERDGTGMRGFKKLLAVRKLPEDSYESKAIRAVIHRLGRLSHHIRAPNQIVEDVSACDQLRNVLDEFDVQSIEQQPVVTRPDAESDISIRGIMNRMLPKGVLLSEPEYMEAAELMNSRHQIVEKFRKFYDDKDFKPVIHAEIQVLEHFWDRQPQKRRRFLGGILGEDRYIGCSKSACYCCHLYIASHPAACVVPQTSRKAYINWGLRALPAGSLDADFPHQLEMVNNINQTIRKEALDQIRRKASASAWHPDSQTGFTPTAPMSLSVLNNPNLGADDPVLDMIETPDDSDSDGGVVVVQDRSQQYLT
ncbi:hypothetical protein GGS20DRAFT_586459 [Poronia punctata]|nr:hypothetical protein GGS20DRAFT_586459 [Poronia punctata]